MKYSQLLLLSLVALPSIALAAVKAPVWDGTYLTGKHVVTIHTSKGDMTIELDADAAPKTVTNFVNLAKAGYYDGLLFHRIIPNFMIQGGDPTGTGGGGESIYGKKFNDEFQGNLPMVRGAIAMANAGPNTNSSQFFIVQSEEEHRLEGVHTVFGNVTKGLDVLDAIANTPRDANDRPSEAVTFTVSVARAASSSSSSISSSSSSRSSSSVRSSSSASSVSLSYKDVPSSAWYFEAVDTFRQDGYLDSTKSNFFPMENTTRAEFLKLLVLLHGGLLHKTSTSSTFSDVSVNDWHFRYMEEAAKEGWIQGDGNCVGKANCMARPNDQITRAEAAVLIARTYQLERTHEADDFVDVPPNAWFSEAVGTLADGCLMQGDGETFRVRPFDNLNRAEMVVLLNRVQQFIVHGNDCSH